jgi:hypothetical protein
MGIGDNIPNEEFIIQSQEIKYTIQTSRSKLQPYNISVPLDLKVTYIYSIYIVWVQIPLMEEQKFDSSKI